MIRDESDGKGGETRARKRKGDDDEGEIGFALQSRWSVTMRRSVSASTHALIRSMNYPITLLSEAVLDRDARCNGRFVKFDNPSIFAQSEISFASTRSRFTRGFRDKMRENNGYLEIRSYKRIISRTPVSLAGEHAYMGA